MTNFKKFIDYDLRNGELILGEVPEWENGVLFSVHHGLVVRFYLPSGKEYDEKEIVKWFREEFGDNLKQLREGVDPWAAQDIEFTIEQRLADLNDCMPGVEIWDASDYWLGGLSHEDAADDIGITSKTTDEELEVLAEKAKVDTRHEHGLIVRGVHGFCEYLRELLREEAVENG